VECYYNHYINSSCSTDDAGKDSQKMIKQGRLAVKCWARRKVHHT